ncbi:hypothetical protein EYF80_017304 [Liparis tanakae]|uniref:Uncharacterized protein n=1 Tax=Liparis tanakae TaxID=230148 RepID=A0A4Z2I3L2_9TELE|nr:hypothetical protein EYF80_017304 [Liparis tanakae]
MGHVVEAVLFATGHTFQSSCKPNRVLVGRSSNNVVSLGAEEARIDLVCLILPCETQAVAVVGIGAGSPRRLHLTQHLAAGGATQTVVARLSFCHCWQMPGSWPLGHQGFEGTRSQRDHKAI